MSEPVFKAPRKIEAISAEYSQLCAKAGQLQYQIFICGKDLQMVNESIQSLNLEAVAANQAAAEEAAKAKAESNVVKLEPQEEKSNG